MRLLNLRGKNVNKDKTKAAFLIWVSILFFEIIWFSLKIDELMSAAEIVFIATVILTTLSVGSLGLKMFGKTKEK